MLPFAPLLALIGLIAGSVFIWLFSDFEKIIRILATIGLVLVFAGIMVGVSTVQVEDSELGIITKKFGGGQLPAGKIIAVNGENGPQAQILGPGFHFLIWPWQYEVRMEPIIEIPGGKVGLITAMDGVPLDSGEIYADEWDDKAAMMDAVKFLTDGGRKGPQATVLAPGKYRLNTMLFRVELQDLTNIQVGHVGVIKSNIGPMTEEIGDGLVDSNMRGIWRIPLKPQKYYMHKGAFEVRDILTLKVKVAYSADEEASTQVAEIRLNPIIVLSKDGFEFPVDVRVIYHIDEQNAPLVVSTVGDDDMILAKVLTPAVRSVFRDNAEQANALDYVKQRSLQQNTSKQMLTEMLAHYGITVDEVLIGRVGDKATLGDLLKTQTDREIAIQQQQTFVQQQKAAEEKKNLTKTEQEAQEEKKLATAEYQVQIAQRSKDKLIIEAEANAEQVKIAATAEAARVKIAAEAEATRIKQIGEAQANAYKVIATALGSKNAALLELLTIAGKNNIKITPDVMVGGSGSGTTDALMGTMLQGMMRESNRGAK
jgi:uncharacterized membrane protein YqiK